MTAADPRVRLIELARSGRPFDFAQQAWLYLAGPGAGDAEITVLTIRALAALGLGGPARELLADEASLTNNGVDVGALRRALAASPIGRAPWTDFETTFQANLAALATHHPAIAARADDIHGSIRGRQMFRSLDGALHVSRRRPGQLREWHPPLTDRSGIDHLSFDPIDTPRLLVGLTPSNIVERIVAASPDRPGGQAVSLCLIEPEWARFAAWLHSGDRRDVLALERVSLWIGPGWSDDLQRALRADDVAIPTQRFSFEVEEDVLAEVSRIVEDAVAHRASEIDHVTGRLELRARERSDAEVAARLRPGATIVGFTSRFTTMVKYAMRDIADACAAHGYRFELITESAAHRQMNWLTPARQMEALDPALVVLINHFRCEKESVFGGAPVLSWLQDPTPLIRSTDTGGAIGPRDFMCGYFEYECVNEYDYPADQFLMTTPIPISTAVFHDAPVEPDRAAELACDLMYVGHCHGTAADHDRAEREKYPEIAGPFLDSVRAVVQEIIRRRQHPLYSEWDGIVADLARGHGLQAQPEAMASVAQYYAHRLFDIHFRLETLQWAAEWCRRTGRRFRLYGRGWDALPAFAEFAAGPIEHGPRLREASRCAALTLQTISTGSLHQRTFEALASGSLVLARHSPQDYNGLSVEEYQQRTGAGEDIAACAAQWPGLHRITFDDRASFEARATQYLDDESARAQTLAAFQDVVHDRFTYQSVVPRLIEGIRDRLAVHAGQDASPTFATLA